MRLWWRRFASEFCRRFRHGARRVKWRPLPGEEIVLMAREGEKEVKAGEWALAGIAASISLQGESLRFTLVETTSLSGAFAVQASQPISLEGERNELGLNVRASLSAPTSLHVTPGFRVRSVSGAKKWR